MATLKENEMLIKQDAVTLKTIKDEISKWQFDINEWFLSLNYTVKEKDLSGRQQLIYENDNHKYTFICHATGRITIRGYDNTYLPTIPHTAGQSHILAICPAVPPHCKKCANVPHSSYSIDFFTSINKNLH